MNGQCYENGGGGDSFCESDYDCGWDGACVGTPGCCMTFDSYECIDEMLDPIVVDLSGSGYELTSVIDGVSFNFTGSRVQQISWTDPIGGNAWLVLDRNANGRIDNGRELFSNISPQQQRALDIRANGFSALAEFDRPENGGNGNGQIDPGDDVFSRLRLWIDRNQDGVSQSTELHTLAEFGIGAIDLHYRKVNRKDRYGNEFQYQSNIIEKDGHPGRRTIWDVVLLQSHVRSVTATSTDDVSSYAVPASKQ